MNPLTGKVALVTGGSRGAGRGIAVELARAGATVYVTGRSVQEQSTKGFPGTIDETVAEIGSFGGTAIAVRCDHTRDEETASVVHRIEQEQGQLDILVNNVWGGNELPIEDQPFWQLPLQHWDHMFHAGLRAQLATNHFAIPLMRKKQDGLIVHTTFWDENKYLGNFYYDLAKHALVRMAYGLATELVQDRITVVAVSPGWMRTELVLAHFKTDEKHWHTVEALKQTESPYYVGRAICALACDPVVSQKSGHVLRVGQLAEEYGFTDIDGRKIPAFQI
ncbi:SDR family oxidoreductase [Brevibacillus humidisoli]|uniref:SDR family NAD(P)-dependent oxidoreductase n=1 Tax=Brevibacillus humidisoli TaxID=2895522 RepID=UPI001E3CF63E|nr:SDR family NAD(P)-dependent oxidoreductase [Brevibacillus humidisoli]UFJ41682.1 SDR family oxidoreductase [Brevibacillus humidisoli]